MTGATLRPEDVCVVVTTYAERGDFCSQVVDRVLQEGVGRVLIVDNGSGPRARQALRAIEARAAAVRIIRRPSNGGSAAGVTAGIEAFLDENTCSLLWILDDDNVPVSGALASLLRSHGATAAPGASLAYRPARPYQSALVGGSSVREAFPPLSAYLYFDIRARLRRLARARPPGTPRACPIEIPYGAYGGLLIDRAAVVKIGVPREDFVLYEDDAEYTSRLSRHGYVLRLVPSAVVEDVDGTWATDDSGGGAVSYLITTPHEARVFYSVRNRVFFESRYRCDSLLAFRLNRTIWMVLLSASALRHRRLRRLQLLLGAMKAGERGILGKDGNYPLPE